MKNHFVSVIGVEYDLDLAPYWIKHYKERDFDTLTVFLHREDGNIPQEVQDIYRKEGFTVHCIEGIYNGGIVGAFHLESFIRNLPPHDFVTVADADEFQSMGDGSPIPYKYLCNQYDVLHGIFEERYTDTLARCVKDPFLQYQYIEPFTGEYFKRFCPPYLEHIDWPPVYRTKIIAARAGESYRYYGIHGFNCISANAKVLYGLKVTHFAWREGSAKKVAKKSYYSRVCTINTETLEMSPVMSGECMP